MNSDTQSVTIGVSKEKAFIFLTNPENMARWAKGICQGVRKDGDEWILETSFGDVRLLLSSDVESGVVDYVLVPAAPMKVTLYGRVLPNGGGSEFLLTHYQLPLLGASGFEKQKEKIGQGLLKLKEILESE